MCPSQANWSEAARRAILDVLVILEVTRVIGSCGKFVQVTEMAEVVELTVVSIQS